MSTTVYTEEQMEILSQNIAKHYRMFYLKIKLDVLKTLTETARKHDIDALRVCDLEKMTQVLGLIIEQDKSKETAQLAAIDNVIKNIMTNIETEVSKSERN